jgi:GT2 family glycosyltransferase
LPGYETPKKGLAMEIFSTIYCVVPVYNRLEVTKRFLEYINAQDYPSVHLVIIDDGSTDGTGEYLEQTSQPNLTVLKGDGTLWWSGAMHLGMSYLMGVAKGSDYLLMINNDVRVGPNYISTMVKESVANNAAVVGSSQRDDASGVLLNSGWRVDFWSMNFVPVDIEGQHFTVDALPGRGVLFPMDAVFQAGNVNPSLFPHYLADIEYTNRISEAGWKIIISKTADVFSSSESSDMHIRAKGILSKYFSFNSRTNLLQRVFFFSVRGPLLLRILAIPRYLLTRILR